MVKRKMNAANGEYGKFDIRKDKIGIRWKMYAIIVLFIAAALICIWFFQIRMLNYFFQNIRFGELEESGIKITESLDDVYSVPTVVDQCAEEYSLSIWVLATEDLGDTKRAHFIAISEEDRENSVPNLSDKIEALYSEAVEHDGEYVAIMKQERFEADSTELIPIKESNGRRYPVIMRNDIDELCALYANIVEIDGNEYVIIQLASMTPLQSVVDTLQYQFICIGIVMGIMAIALTALLTKFITKPIVRMNEAAKHLAEGRYDIDFSGKGYREINELGDTLNFASTELAKTDKFQKELISNVSHDLKTPLTMIKGYSEIMRDIPGENTPENVQVVIDETARLSELVNDVLDLSKIKSGTRKPELTEFSLTQTVRDTLARYEKLVMQEGYKISFDFDGDAEIIADRGMILQVVYNLVNNAINYIGDDKTVIVKQTMTEKTVRISVSDNGEGIAPDELPLIWDRYYKVDKVHRRATVGTGLGLSIVKEILGAHNASYGVESAVGRGSTFWFEIALAVKPIDITAQIIDAEYDNDDSEEI